MADVEFIIDKDNTKAILDAEEKAVNAVLELIGGFVEDESKINLTKNGSVDTGNLRNSMTHEVKESEKAVYIGTVVKYAPYIEYGHRVGKSNTFVAPKPYLKPAVMNNQDKIKGFIEKQLGKS